MAAPPEPPQAPAAGGLDVDLELVNLGIRLRFKCSTGVAVLLSVTGITLGAIFGKERIKPVVEQICNAVFGVCNVTEGSILVDVDCFSIKRVKDLLDDYKCGKLKRRFLEDLQKFGGNVEDLKIKFEVKQTLQLNEDLKLRIFQQSKMKQSAEKTDEPTTGMSENEFIETLESIKMLDGATERFIHQLSLLQGESGFRFAGRGDYSFGGHRSYSVTIPESVPDSFDEYGRTVLHYAIYLEDEVLRSCLQTVAVNAQDCDGRTPLHVACIRRDPEIESLYHKVLHRPDEYISSVCMILHEHGANIDAKDSEDRTPLHYAAMYNENLVSTLIRLNANIYATDANGKTPLDHAFWHGKTEAIKYLLQHFGQNEKVEDVKRLVMKDINTVDAEGRNILHHAAVVSNPAAITKIINAGVNLNAIDKKGKTAMDYALERSNLKSAVALFDRMLEEQSKQKPNHLPAALKKNVKMKDVDARTMLHYSVIHFKQNALNLLLTYEVDVNDRDGEGKSPLLYAVELGNVEAADKLLKAGASVKGKDANRRTVLHLAAQHGNEKLLDLFLENNANLNDLDNKGNSAVYYAVKLGNDAIAEKLIKAGASVEGKDCERRTVLHLAVQHGDEKLLDLLLKNNTNVNDLDSKGNSALYYAVKRGNVAFAGKLFKAGSRVEGNYEEGRTVLHLAAQHGDETELLDLLLKNNINLNDLDSKGNSALYYAVKRGNVAVAGKLLKAGASVDGKDDEGRTVLHFAAQHGDEKLLALLLENNVHLNDYDDEGETALHYAVEFGHGDAARILLEAGADVNVENKKTFTPLHRAVMLRLDDIIELLLKHKANPAVEDYIGKTALTYALDSHRSPGIIKKMEEAIASLSLEGSGGKRVRR